MQALISDFISARQNRKIGLFLILLLPFIGLMDCSKEKFATKEYPRVLTVSASRTSDL